MIERASRADCRFFLKRPATNACDDLLDPKAELEGDYE